MILLRDIGDRVILKPMNEESSRGEFEALVARLRPLFRKHRILRAIVFGSLSRGDATRHSDLDLLLVQDTELRFLDRYDDLLPEIVRSTPGRDVDLLIYTPDELRDAVDRPFIATALKEGKVIYEREQEPA